MTNYERYLKEINTNKDYMIKKQEFVTWLKEEGKEKEFKETLNKEDVYFIAVDYSISIAMIKALKKEYL